MKKPEMLNLIGDVDNKMALIVDDLTISGSTLVQMAHLLIERGALDVYVLVTHGALSSEGVARIDDSPIRRILMTNTIETQPL